jgi:hypothetical protein
VKIRAQEPSDVEDVHVPGVKLAGSPPELGDRHAHFALHLAFEVDGPLLRGEADYRRQVRVPASFGLGLISSLPTCERDVGLAGQPRADSEDERPQAGVDPTQWVG